jgi:shikimate kinase
MSTDSHLFLIGFMGAGKSTVGRLVADRIGRPFVDLDSLIEREAGMRITQIFAESGEERFRELESRALAAMASRPPSVVACGGGIVLSDENRLSLQRLGTIVYLKVTAGEAVARVGDGGTRPLLAGPGGALAATTLLAARESLYSSVADITVDTSGRRPSEVASEVATAYEGHDA